MRGAVSVAVREPRGINGRLESFRCRDMVRSSKRGRKDPPARPGRSSEGEQLIIAPRRVYLLPLSFALLVCLVPRPAASTPVLLELNALAAGKTGDGAGTYPLSTSLATFSRAITSPTSISCAIPCPSDHFSLFHRRRRHGGLGSRPSTGGIFEPSSRSNEESARPRVGLPLGGNHRLCRLLGAPRSGFTAVPERFDSHGRHRGLLRSTWLTAARHGSCSSARVSGGAGKDERKVGAAPATRHDMTERTWARGLRGFMQKGGVG
jgi:hypothetical protein